MATVTVPQPVIMDFTIDTGKTFVSTRYYNLAKGKDLFSNQVNISVNRGFSKALYTYSLKIRNNGKWSPQITGLFPTHDPDIFYGDTENKKHLLIARFLSNGTKLRLYHFNNFYTRRITDFLKVFKDTY